MTLRWGRRIEWRCSRDGGGGLEGGTGGGARGLEGIGVDVEGREEVLSLGEERRSCIGRS